MIFKVSEDYNGSFVLSSIGVILRAGKKVCIEGKKILSPDVKMAIKNKILVPFEEENNDEYIEKYSDKSNELMVVNKTDKILSINKIILKPWACLLLNKESVDNSSFKSAEEKGYISIISDDDKNIKDIKKLGKSINISGVKKSSIKKQENKKQENKKNEDIDAIVWDFDKQKIKKAEIIEITAQPKYVDEEKEDDIFKDDIFIDRDNKKEIKVEKTSKKKTSKKKTSKKKVKNSNEGKNKEIKPIGEKKENKYDNIIELDSRGNPINKVSDVLIELIETVEKKEISFVDEEQKIEKLKKMDFENENNRNA